MGRDARWAGLGEEKVICRLSGGFLGKQNVCLEKGCVKNKMSVREETLRREIRGCQEEKEDCKRGLSGNKETDV